MNATITKITKNPSKHGGMFYYCFFKGDDGKSYKSCLYEEMRNFPRWKPIIDRVENGKETVLYNLRLKNDEYIDADSQFSTEIDKPQRTNFELGRSYIQEALGALK